MIHLLVSNLFGQYHRYHGESLYHCEDINSRVFHHSNIYFTDTCIYEDVMILICWLEYYLEAPLCFHRRLQLSVIQVQVTIIITAQISDPNLPRYIPSMQCNYGNSHRAARVIRWFNLLQTNKI